MTQPRKFDQAIADQLEREKAAGRKPGLLATVTDTQRAVLREVAEEWVRRDAEEPPLRAGLAAAMQRGIGDEPPVAAYFFERFSDMGEWGVLARFRAPELDGRALVLEGSAEARARRRAACLRAIGLLCQEVGRLDGEARTAGAPTGGEVSR